MMPVYVIFDDSVIEIIGADIGSLSSLYYYHDKRQIWGDATLHENFNATQSVQRCVGTDFRFAIVMIRPFRNYPRPPWTRKAIAILKCRLQGLKPHSSRASYQTPVLHRTQDVGQ